ncbi:DUF3784 domain-containing protein [Capnocytophaga cynodegmi]
MALNFRLIVLKITELWSLINSVFSMAMIISIFVGLLFIGIGYFVQSNPTILAGYNRMSEEQRSNLDIKKIAKHFKKAFVTMGILLIMGFPIMFFLDWEEYVSIWILLVMFIGIGYTLKSSEKFLHNTKRNHTIVYIILIITFLFCLMIIFSGMSSMEIMKEGDTIRITDTSEKEIFFSEIQEIKLVSELPKIAIRRGGFELGGVKKGKFETKDKEEVFLYLQSKNSPYIMFVRKDGEKIFYNDENPEKTQQTYQQIIK